MTKLFWQYRKLFLGLIFLICLGFSFFLPYVKFDNSLEALSLENDKSFELLKKVEGTFGSEEFIAISFASDSIFSPQSLSIINEITQFLKSQNEVARVLSLTSLWQVKAHTLENEATLEITDLIKASHKKDGVPHVTQAEILAHPLYQNLIFSTDGKATSIIATLIPLGQEDARRSQLIDKIRPFIKHLEKTTSLKIHIFGFPVYHRAIFGTLEQEQKTQAPLMVLAIVLLMYISYRHFFVSLTPLFVMGVVWVCLLGLLGALGLKLNWLTSAVPSVILIVSVCDSMHVLQVFLNSKNTGYARFIEILKSAGRPSLVTALTTAIGFASMGLTPIKIVREFGFYVACGVLLAFGLTFTLYILVLELLPFTRLQVKIKQGSSLVQGLLRLSLKCVEHYPKPIMATSVLILCISLYGATKINADTLTFGLLKNDPFSLKEANAFIAKGVGGGSESYVFLETKTQGGFYEPNALKKIEALQTQSLQKAPEVVKSLSLVDLIKYFNQKMHNNDPSFYRIPDTRAEIAQLFFLMEMQRDRLDLDSFVSADYSEARVRFYSVLTQSNKRVLELEKITQNFINENLSQDFKASFTGRGFITAKVIDYLPKSLMISLFSSALLIGVLMILLFKSVKVGLLAMLDNIFTVIIGMGIMGYLGMELNVATCMVFSVVLGIADDDTLHLVWHLKENVESGLNYKDALRKTFNEVGVPLVTSTLVLVGGFLMLTFSNNKPVSDFGFLVAVCCVVALFVDLLLTSALFMWLKPFKTKNLKA